MIKWMRPSGTFIETAEGEGIEAYAKEHGWVRASKSFGELKEESEVKEVKKKRQRRTKAEMEAARNGNSRTSTEGITE